MKKNPNYEIEINLRDLFYHILARWRSIIVAMLICAIALGGFRFYRNNKNADANEVERENYEKQLDFYQKSYDSYTKVIDSCRNQLNNLNQYKDNSVRMQIDSYNEWVARCEYYVEVDKSVLDELPEGIDQDPADNILGVYRALLYTEVYDNELESITGIKNEEYLRELVNWSVDQTVNSLTISIIGNSREQIEDMLNFYMNKVESTLKAEADKVGAHNLIMSNKSVYLRVDGTLRVEQKGIDDTILAIETSMANAKRSQDALVKPVEPAYLEKTAGVKKYAILGLFLGVFLMVCCYAVNYVLARKLRSTDDIQALYNIPMFGIIPNAVTRKPGKGIDKLIEKIRNKKVGVDKKVACGQVAAMISSNLEGRKVVIVSASASDKVKEFFDTQKDMVAGKANISLEQDFLKNVDAVKEINAADAILVAEVRNDSDISNIERMVEILDISGREVKGCIVL